MKGELKRWNDEKGFGFISPHGGGHDVFIHVSALKKNARRPVVGDAITFEVHFDNNGKKRAVNASIEGVPSIRANPKKPRTKHIKKGSGIFGRVMALILVLGMSVVAYSVMSGKSGSVLNASRSQPFSSAASPRNNDYSCAGKVHCSEMSSCDEAHFYLENCPRVKIDGDGDGVPCERQLCGR